MNNNLKTILWLLPVWIFVPGSLIMLAGYTLFKRKRNGKINNFRNY
jgi:hypothetical protein